MMDTSRSHALSSFPSMLEHYMSDSEYNDFQRRQKDRWLTQHDMKLFNSKDHLMDNINEGVTARNHRKSPKSPSEKKSKNFMLIDETGLTEREIEKLKTRQEKYKNALYDLTILRDHYKAELKRKLEEKMATQRRGKMEQLKRDRVTEMKKIVNDTATNKVNVRVPSLEQHDENETFSKSFYYRVLEIQDHLDKKGELDKKFKVDEISRLLSIPGNLNTIEEELRRGHTPTYENICQLLQEKDDQQHNCMKRTTGRNIPRRLLSIRTSSVDRDKSPKKKKQRPTNDVNNEGCIDGKCREGTNMLNMEQLFPRIEFPVLSIVNRHIGTPLPDPIEVEKQLQRERRTEHHLEQKRKLKKMFQHSMANEAATGRLMRKYQHYDFTCQSESSGIDELMVLSGAALSPDLKKTSKDKQIVNVVNTGFTEKIARFADDTHKSADHNRDPKKELMDYYYHQNRLLLAGLIGEGSEYGSQRAYADEEIIKQLRGDADPERQITDTVPLTIKAAEETSVVKVIEGISSLWINPTHNV